MNTRDADRKIYALSKDLYIVTFLDPVNKKEELEKVLKDPTYDPQLEYKVPDLSGLLKKLDFSIDKSVIGQMIEEKRKDVVRQVQLLQSVGDPKL